MSKQIVKHCYKSLFIASKGSKTFTDIIKLWQKHGIVEEYIKREQHKEKWTERVVYPSLSKDKSKGH